LCNAGAKTSQAPRILSWDTTLLEVMGWDIELPCYATGSPSPNVHWIEEDQENNTSSRHTVSKIQKVGLI